MPPKRKTKHTKSPMASASCPVRDLSSPRVGNPRVVQWRPVLDLQRAPGLQVVTADESRCVTSSPRRQRVCDPARTTVVRRQHPERFAAATTTASAAIRQRPADTVEHRLYRDAVIHFRRAERTDWRSGRRQRARRTAVTSVLALVRSIRLTAVCRL